MGFQLWALSFYCAFACGVLGAILVLKEAYVVLCVGFVSIRRLLCRSPYLSSPGSRSKISVRYVHTLQLLFECIRILFGFVDPCLSMSMRWNSCSKIEFSCTTCILINPNVFLAGLMQMDMGHQILQETNFFMRVQIASTLSLIHI